MWINTGLTFMKQVMHSVLGLVSALSPEAWYNLGLVVVILALVVSSILGYRAWQEAHEDTAPATSEELMASFEEARARGEIDEEEYAKIRERIERTRRHGST
jgi:uncharacterized membrane protein